MFYSILLYCAAAILGDMLMCIVCIVVFMCCLIVI